MCSASPQQPPKPWPLANNNRRRRLIHPKSITILYCDFTLFIDIFHFKVLFLCCFGLFYTVYNFPVPKQQNQDSAIEKWIPSCLIRSSQNAINFTGSIFMSDDWDSPK